MKKFIFLILLILLINKYCFCLEMNGSHWRLLSEEAKVAWLAGFADAISIISNENQIFLSFLGMSIETKYGGVPEDGYSKGNQMNKLFNKRISWANLNCEDLASGLNKFYKNSQNRNITIKEAIYIVKVKLMGAPQEFIQEQIRIVKIYYKERNEEQISLWENNYEYKKAWERWGKYIPISISRAFYQPMLKLEE